jgi:hypothetical protein
MRGGANAQPGISQTAGNSHAHRHMGKLFAFIALDRGRVDGQLLELIIE